MARPALTVALLLSSSTPVDTYRQWLPANRYESLLLSVADNESLATTLAPRHNDFDAVVVEQKLLDGGTREDLLKAGLLFPAVIVGEVKGHVDYHQEELHLPEDQLAQLGYNIDAAISRFLRQGREDGRQEDAATKAVGTLSRRLQERLGYLGVFYKRDPSRFLGSLPLMSKGSCSSHCSAPIATFAQLLPRSSRGQPGSRELREYGVLSVISPSRALLKFT
jgi:circadian clock protein KaiA